VDQQVPGTGAVPQWVVDETARLGTSPDQWSSRPRVRQKAPRSVWHAVLVLLLVLDLGLGAALLAGGGSFGQTADPVAPIGAPTAVPKRGKGRG
jgi:hypothetical protein